MLTNLVLRCVPLVVYISTSMDRISTAYQGRLQNKNIPTKSMYGEGYPTEGKRICAFQWNHGLWNLSRNLRGQLVTICGCTVPWWFSALSGNGNKILWSSYKLWLYVYILRFYIQAHKPYRKRIKRFQKMYKPYRIKRI